MKKINLGGFQEFLKVICLTALAGVLLTVTGCGHSTVIDTKAAGHQIRVIIAGNHSVNSQPDRATITSAFGTVTVERTRVQVGGAPWCMIPEAVPVELRISKGRIALTAGHVSIRQSIN